MGGKKMNYKKNGLIRLNGIKRSMAFILMLAMVITSLGISGWSTDEVYADTPKSINCYLTISVAGEIPEGTGDTTIAQVPVTVIDQNGNNIFDIDDALFALHEAYYNGDTTPGYSSEEGAYGLGITRLWGDTSGSYGYYVNNKSALSLVDQVQGGDYISAFVYSDGLNWSDSYTKFDTFTKTSALGEDINLDLEKGGYEAGAFSWSDLTGAAIYDIENLGVSLATSDDSGNAIISFPSIGTYYITASHSSLIIVPPVCKITVVEPDNYATVRIEGNGFGADGTDNNINTVLDNTMVNLDTLDAEYKAIDVVNAALTASDLTEAEKGTSGMHTTFGGVSGENGEGWAFILNDEIASDGLDGQVIFAGDDIVLMLTGSDDNYYMTTEFSCFKTVSASSDVQGGYPYGEVSLALYSKRQIGCEDPVWDVSPVTNTPIYSNGNQASTPNGYRDAVTDNENGMATITLWGGAAAGTYYFDITATVEGATSAYCRATMVYDGVNAPVLTFSAPSAKDTTLSELVLNFPEAAATNGLSYVGENGMSVGSGIESLNIYATSNAMSARINATYKAAGNSEALGYTLGQNVDLAVGENTFKLVVTNNTDTQIHTLIVVREAEEARDIPAEVSSLINGVKGVKGWDPYTDWVLAMNAGGFSLNSSEIETYLAAVLSTVDKFYNNETGNPASLAKIAIALTSLGIDPRQIPDEDNGEGRNLISAVAAEYDVSEDDSPANSAPFFLALYDLGHYSVPDSAISSREDLIDDLLDKKDTWGHDGLGMALLGLAPYYNAGEAVNGISLEKCIEVKEAVNQAIDSLSEAQTVDGGLGEPNSSTVSTVIAGLNAIEKNPHSNNDFIKSGKSLLMNLLSFRTSDNKLGYTNAATANEFSCLQGFQALTTYQNLTNTRSSSLLNFDKEIAVYTNWPDAKLLTSIQALPDIRTYEIGESVDYNTITVQAIYNGDYSTVTTVAITSDNVTHPAFNTVGNYTVTVNYLSQETSYVVSVGSDSTTPVGPSISATIRDGNTIIASNGTLMIENGKTSALSALKMLAAEAGISIVVKGGYVSEINGLGEFSRGENSGWLYSVNGTAPPTTSSKDYLLKKDDVLEWYYTRDYKSDPSSSAWQNNEEKNTEFVAKEDGKGSATVEVTKADMDKLIKEGGSLKAKSSIATIELDAATLKGLGGQMGKDLEITAKKVDITEREDISQEMKDKIGDRPVLDLTVMSGTKQIAQFDGSVRVSIPYTLKEGEDPSAVIIYLIKDNGEIEVVKNAEFEPLTGEVKFTTSHFSLYGIGYKELGFNDIKGHWAKDYITYLAARDYITGMTKDNFDPNGTLTRGQFVQLLANLANVDLKKYGSTEPSSINDIKSTDWFAPAVAWAVEQGIVTGITLPDGTTSFYPEKSISRQDIAVMLNRYRDKIDKKEFPEAVKEKAFQDKDQIGGYAVDSVKALQKSGIIQGKSQTTFAPLDQAKRGEAAKMIHGMLKLN